MGFIVGCPVTASTLVADEKFHLSPRRNSRPASPGSRKVRIASLRYVTAFLLPRHGPIAFSELSPLSI
jgi:hypothetical protein